MQKNEKKPSIGEIVVLLLLFTLTTTITGCGGLTQTQMDAAKAFLQSQPNGGCFCVNQCSAMQACLDQPGATVTYTDPVTGAPVTVNVGCYCICSSFGVNGSCEWNDQKWVKRTKIDYVEVEPDA